LIIFAAPIVAVPEFHAKYRLHGANLFQAKAEDASSSQIEHRMEMRAALLGEIQNWLERHGHELSSPDLQAYFKQWTKSQEVDSFALDAPGCWKYFRHLIEYPLIYGDLMTARHRTYSYVRAFSALFLGYHHVHVLDDVRMTFKRFLSSASEDSSKAAKEGTEDSKS
jgi:hypothetical protein